MEREAKPHKESSRGGLSNKSLDRVGGRERDVLRFLLMLFIQSVIGCQFSLLNNVCIFYVCKDLALLLWYAPQTKMKIIRGNLFPLILIKSVGWCQSAIGCIILKSISKFLKTSLFRPPTTYIDLERITSSLVVL